MELLDKATEMTVAIEDFKETVAGTIEEMSAKYGEEPAAVLQEVSEAHFRVTDTVMDLLLNAIRRYESLIERLNSLE